MSNIIALVIQSEIFRSNDTKRTAVLVIAVFARALIMGPTLTSISCIFAKQNYENWSHCREDQGKNWFKKYFKKHHDVNRNSASRDSRVIRKLLSSGLIVYLQETLPIRQVLVEQDKKNKSCCELEADLINSTQKII